MGPDYETQNDLVKKNLYYRGMKTKKKRPKIHEIRAYVGCGVIGAYKCTIVRQKAKRMNMNVSRLIVEALNKLYPDLDL